jgi:hypothetical protein
MACSFQRLYGTPNEDAVVSSLWEKLQEEKND